MEVAVYYSTKFEDDIYEYRNVTVPHKIANLLPMDHCLTETDWRNLGIRQSPGWIHYTIHPPEKNILLFRRRKKIQPKHNSNE